MFDRSSSLTNVITPLYVYSSVSIADATVESMSIEFSVKNMHGQ